ncbi:MAG: hypothetical protein WCO55_02360 [Candidatus Falkowbacteria bacterium]
MASTLDYDPKLAKRLDHCYSLYQLTNLLFILAGIAAVVAIFRLIPSLIDKILVAQALSIVGTWLYNKLATNFERYFFYAVKQASEQLTAIYNRFELELLGLEHSYSEFRAKTKVDNPLSFWDITSISQLCGSIPEACLKQTLDEVDLDLMDNYCRSLAELRDELWPDLSQSFTDIKLAKGLHAKKFHDNILALLDNARCIIPGLFERINKGTLAQPADQAVAQTWKKIMTANPMRN